MEDRDERNEVEDVTECANLDESLVVSVVVPTYDRRDLVIRCVEALAAQRFESFEVIVVDDGSTDDSVARLEKLASEHPGLRLQVLVNDVNRGANYSRNRGIRAARGGIVAFLDSDCLARPDWLPRLVAGFEDERIAAITGLVVDPEPRNVWELAFKGTHRIARAGPARRLIAGNMAVRRSLLRAYALDEDYGFRPDRPDLGTSGRCDEEGLFLRLRANGHRVIARPDAVVDHEHHYDRASFFRQAYRGGRSAARLVYKFHLRPRIDMLPFIATYALLPLALLDSRLLGLSGVSLLSALAAISYNDLHLKGKSIGETLRSFPALVAYYHVRLIGYIHQTIALHLGSTGIRRERLG